MPSHRPLNDIARADTDLVLPRLATASSLFLLILIGFLVALVVTLAGLGDPVEFWTRFGLSLLFVEWIVLVSAFAFDGMRRILPQQYPWLAAWVVFLIVPTLTLLTSLAVARLGLFALDMAPAWFVMRNCLIAMLVSLALVRYLILQQRWRSQVAAESRARLDSLQARIRPHFLFNALNTIASLIPDKPAQAEEATLDLADLLRTGLRDASRHSLEEELSLVRGYLRLESLRLGDRLEVDWQLDEDLPLDFRLPALLIQPLVENAIVHGIAARPEGGLLRIVIAQRRFKRLQVDIDNPMAETAQTVGAGHHMAQANIRQRLSLAYGERAGLKIEQDGSHYRARLFLPLED